MAEEQSHPFIHSRTTHASEQPREHLPGGRFSIPMKPSYKELPKGSPAQWALLGQSKRHRNQAAKFSPELRKQVLRTLAKGAAKVISENGSRECRGETAALPSLSDLLPGSSSTHRPHPAPRALQELGGESCWDAAATGDGIRKHSA